MEWRERWVVIRDGVVRVCKNRDDTTRTHTFSLSALVALRGAERLAHSIAPKRRSALGTSAAVQRKAGRSDRPLGYEGDRDRDMGTTRMPSSSFAAGVGGGTRPAWRGMASELRPSRARGEDEEDGFGVNLAPSPTENAQRGEEVRSSMNSASTTTAKPGTSTSIYTSTSTLASTYKPHPQMETHPQSQLQPTPDEARLSLLRGREVEREHEERRRERERGRRRREREMEEMERRRARKKAGEGEREVPGGAGPSGPIASGSAAGEVAAGGEERQSADDLMEWAKEELRTMARESEEREREEREKARANDRAYIPASREEAEAAGMRIVCAEFRTARVDEDERACADDEREPAAGVYRRTGHRYGGYQRNRNEGQGGMQSQTSTQSQSRGQLGQGQGKEERKRPKGAAKRRAYTPRPPNGFMLFRADFVRQKQAPGSIETNHGSLSKMIGNCWRQLPLDQKRVWESKAKQEMANHKAMHPPYRLRTLHNKNKNRDSSNPSASSSATKEKPQETVEERQRPRTAPRRREEERGEWIVLDMGNDNAFNSILQILHRHIDPPFVSSFIPPAIADSAASAHGHSLGVGYSVGNQPVSPYANAITNAWLSPTLVEGPRQHQRVSHAGSEQDPSEHGDVHAHSQLHSPALASLYSLSSHPSSHLRSKRPYLPYLPGPTSLFGPEEPYPDWGQLEEGPLGVSDTDEEEGWGRDDEDEDDDGIEARAHRFAAAISDRPKPKSDLKPYSYLHEDDADSHTNKLLSLIHRPYESHADASHLYLSLSDDASDLEESELDFWDENELDVWEESKLEVFA